MDTYIQQSFGNDVGFFHEILVISNRRDKMPQWFKSPDGQASTNNARPERDPVHGLKACVYFIEIGAYEPVMSLQFRN